MNSNKRSLPELSRFQLLCPGTAGTRDAIGSKIRIKCINELTSFKVFFSTIKWLRLLAALNQGPQSRKEILAFLPLCSRLRILLHTAIASIIQDIISFCSSETYENLRHTNMHLKTMRISISANCSYYLKIKNSDVPLSKISCRHCIN